MADQEPDMKDALDVHRTLLARETQHKIIRLRRMVMTADELPQVLDVPAERCLTVRMYVADGRLVAVIVPAGRVPSGLAVTAATSARRTVPAPAALVNTVTGYAAGLVSPVLLPSTVTVLIDRCAQGSYEPDDIVYAATGDSGTALRARAADLYAASGARPVPVSALPPPAGPAGPAGPAAHGEPAATTPRPPWEAAEHASRRPTHSLR